MLCAGSTVGESCGGFYKMTVYEITAYNRCNSEAFGESLRLEPLPGSKDQQILGQPWDFQGKFETTRLLSSTQGRPSRSSDVRARSCNV